MTKNPAAAMVAGRGELVDGALKTVESVRLSGERNLKCLVVSVAADFAGCHLWDLRVISSLKGRILEEKQSSVGAAVWDMTLRSCPDSAAPRTLRHSRKIFRSLYARIQP